MPRSIIETKQLPGAGQKQSFGPAASHRQTAKGRF